jgi:hypothetical protein
MGWHKWGNQKDEKWDVIEYNLTEVSDLIIRSLEYATDREVNFMKSCQYHLSEKEQLSFSQNRWLKTLMEKYSDEGIKLERDWRKCFDKERRKIAYRVAQYYQYNPPYYKEIVKRVLSNPDDFVLSRAEWKSFCENKYALKITKLYDTALKFHKSDCIQIRANNKIPLANRGITRMRPPRPNHVGFILETDALPITRSAKGARIYKILLTGEVSPIYAHESDLKRKR